MKSPKEIWNASEAKYKTEKVVERVIDLDLKGCWNDESIIKKIQWNKKIQQNKA